MVSGLDPAVVVDISSDEEEEEEEEVVGGILPEDLINDFLVGGEAWADDFIAPEWLLMPAHGAGSRRSLNGASKPKASLAGAKPASCPADDDCVVLDGDPDGQMSEANTGNGDRGCGNESEDLEVVGEKGQLACRDYPHPRHLCANFPFNTSPHEKFCKMCHCYVCDSHAPCTYWGNGLSVSDHCHSTDKEGKWKRARKSFKKLNMAGHPIKSPYGEEQVAIPGPKPVQIFSSNGLPHPTVSTLGPLGLYLTSLRPGIPRTGRQHITKQLPLPPAPPLLPSMRNVQNTRHTFPYPLPVMHDNLRFKRHGVAGRAPLDNSRSRTHGAPRPEPFPTQNAQSERPAHSHAAPGPTPLPTWNAQRERPAHSHAAPGSAPLLTQNAQREMPAHSHAAPRPAPLPTRNAQREMPAHSHAAPGPAPLPTRNAQREMPAHSHAAQPVRNNLRYPGVVRQNASCLVSVPDRPSDTQPSQQAAVVDDRIWKFILAKVADDLGVGEDNTRSTPTTQPQIYPSTPTTHQKHTASGRLDTALPIYTGAPIGITGHVPAAQQPLNTPVCQSNPVIGTVGPVPLPSDLEPQAALGPANQQLLQFCDLNSSWSALSQV